MSYFINFNDSKRIQHLQEGLDDALETCTQAACGIVTTGITLRYLDNELNKGNYEHAHRFATQSNSGKHSAGTGSVNIGWINLCYNNKGEIVTIRFSVNQDTDDECKDFFKAYKTANGINGNTHPQMRRSFYRFVYKEYFKSI